MRIKALLNRTNHDHGLLLVRGQVGGPGRHDDLVGAVHHRLTVVGLLDAGMAGLH